MIRGLQERPVISNSQQQKTPISFQQNIKRTPAIKVSPQKDSVSFTAKQNAPYIIEGWFQDRQLVLPENYTTDKPLNIRETIEIKKGAKINKVTCFKTAYVKGSVDTLRIKAQVGSLNKIIAGRNAKIKELIIEKDVNPVGFQMDEYYRECVLEGEELMHYGFFADISKKALNNPDNFQRVVINGKEVPREEFVKFASKPNQDQEINGFLAFTPDSIMTIIKSLWDKNYDRNIAEKLIKPEARDLPEEQIDDYYRERLKLEAKFKNDDLLEPFQEEILAQKLNRQKA